jgi:hypothetical protein
MERKTTRSNGVSIMDSRLTRRGRNKRWQPDTSDEVSGADLVVAVGQGKKGAGQKKEWVPRKKAFSDDILEKPCCLHSNDEYGPAKHKLRQCRALKRMQSEKDKDAPDDDSSKEGDDPANGFPGENAVLLIFAGLEVNRVRKVPSREVNMAAPVVPTYLN